MGVGSNTVFKDSNPGQTHWPPPTAAHGDRNSDEIKTKRPHRMLHSSAAPWPACQAGFKSISMLATMPAHQPGVRHMHWGTLYPIAPPAALQQPLPSMPQASHTQRSRADSQPLQNLSQQLSTCSSLDAWAQLMVLHVSGMQLRDVEVS